jgi:hypothetical protein
MSVNVRFQEDGDGNEYDHLPLFNKFVAKSTGGFFQSRFETNIVLITLSICMLVFSFFYSFSHTKYAYPSTKDHTQEEREALETYKATGRFPLEEH